jgi:hypothetical protein
MKEQMRRMEMTEMHFLRAVAVYAHSVMNHKHDENIKEQLQITDNKQL